MSIKTLAIWLIGLAGFAVSICPAAAQTERSQIGRWEIVSGKSFCWLSADDARGREVSITFTPPFMPDQIWLRDSDEAVKIIPKSRYSRVTIDDVVFSADATGSFEPMRYVEVDDSRLMRAVRYGSRLNMMIEGRSRSSLSLAGSGKALDALSACLKKISREDGGTPPTITGRNHSHTSSPSKQTSDDEPTIDWSDDGSISRIRFANFFVKPTPESGCYSQDPVEITVISKQLYTENRADDLIRGRDASNSVAAYRFPSFEAPRHTLSWLDQMVSEGNRLKVSFQQCGMGGYLYLTEIQRVESK